MVLAPSLRLLAVNVYLPKTRITGTICSTLRHLNNVCMDATATPTFLLGPPELCNYTPQLPKTTGDEFLDMLKNGMTGDGSKFVAPPPPAMGRTENNSPTFLSSGDACLDFFFHVVPHTPSKKLVALLESAWNKDPLTALKLVRQLRGVRGTGKSDRNGFYTAAYWMHCNHPHTLAANVRSFGEFGYLKDLPEVLLRVLKDHKNVRKRRIQRKPGYRFDRKGAVAREAMKLGTLKPREERIAADLLKGKQDKENARVAREQRRLEDASRALQRYHQDPLYRALHDKISLHFADLLVKDLEAIKSQKNPRLTLAAKWCPSSDSSYDLSTLLCENIARRVFPREEYADVVDDRHYAYRVRERLRKEVLVPLRKAMHLPEVYMSANLWGELRYNRVASVAMKNYKGLFFQHDSKRSAEFLGDVKKGKKKIAAGALLPHEILEQVLAWSGHWDDEVAELQWKQMVEDMRKEGKFSSSLAVCDVSGSMEGTPMDVCIALGLLVSDMSEEPWRGHIITFSENPELHLVQGESLAEKYAFTENTEWDMNTDFQKVFDLLLTMACKNNLPPEKMIKQLFVFSDMEFDEASLNPWETDYMVIKRKFREAGYGVPPRIVFWNLGDSQSTPVLMEEEGVAMVSGFSKNMVKMFLRDTGNINPTLIMNAAIRGKLYQNLVVID
ncbi:hypothetical protein KI387_001261 [Taxus chinensis]|uniref:Uncharacterized protein n=1 Tax=Taxus chinensis TaxID=29808 RepID=A0AA38GUJ9_TAXCH|nr:hypothetical protein KI387_001261 [Taxus chinensis]